MHEMGRQQRKALLEPTARKSAHQIARKAQEGAVSDDVIYTLRSAPCGCSSHPLLDESRALRFTSPGRGGRQLLSISLVGSRTCLGLSTWCWPGNTRKKSQNKRPATKGFLWRYLIPGCDERGFGIPGMVIIVVVIVVDPPSGSIPKWGLR